jgi:hypothetical protein
MRRTFRIEYVDIAPDPAKTCDTNALRTLAGHGNSRVTLAQHAGRERPPIVEVRNTVHADAGHLIALERPEATAELLQPWLERVSA